MHYSAFTANPCNNTGIDPDPGWVLYVTRNLMSGEVKNNYEPV